MRFVYTPVVIMVMTWCSRTPKQTPHFDTRSEINPSRTLVKYEIMKTLKVHKTSEIVRENAYGIVSRARWVISALVSDLSLA